MILILGLALCLLAAPVPSDAQQPGKVYRIGFLNISAAGYETDPHHCFLPGKGTPIWQAWMEGLRERAYISGQNLVIECRHTQARPLWGASATLPPKRPAGRNRLQAPAAYPGGVEDSSREAGACAATGIPAEPIATSAEIGCSSLQA